MANFQITWNDQTKDMPFIEKNQKAILSFIEHQIDELKSHYPDTFNNYPNTVFINLLVTQKEARYDISISEDNYVELQGKGNQLASLLKENLTKPLL